MARAILLGTNERQALAICRSLGQSGISVDIVRVGSKSIAEKSVYASNVYDPPTPLENVETFAQELKALLARKVYDLLIPVDDVSSEICSAYRTSLTRFVRIAMPEEESY